MSQALYAHMNNKRKMKKKKTNSCEQVCVLHLLLKAGPMPGADDSCQILAT
jgi:hypothetical protein